MAHLVRWFSHGSNVVTGSLDQHPGASPASTGNGCPKTAATSGLGPLLSELIQIIWGSEQYFGIFFGSVVLKPFLCAVLRDVTRYGVKPTGDLPGGITPYPDARTAAERCTSGKVPKSKKWGTRGTPRDRWFISWKIMENPSIHFKSF